jgi:hypothetical protein
MLGYLALIATLTLGALIAFGCWRLISARRLPASWYRSNTPLFFALLALFLLFPDTPILALGLAAILIANRKAIITNIRNFLSPHTFPRRQ